MGDYQEKFQQCRTLVRERLQENMKNSEWASHIWDVWFKDITLVDYSPEQKVATLSVPSSYVYEYIEQFFAKTVGAALAQVFGPGVRLQYRIARQEPSFQQVAEYLQQHSAYDTRRDPYHIRINNARKRMEDGLHYFLKGREKWLPGYDRMASWLTDNKGRGLLCVGTSGLGKTLLCRNILPVILGNGGRPIPCVNAADLRSSCEDLKKERICIIDDLGHEPRKYYGDIDNSFFELCNNAERTGNLLIITTNLSPNIIDPRHPDAAVYPDSIERRYGREVLDRLKVITSVAVFKGESLRQLTIDN